jgi:iron-sulfur cluster assembly protein
LTDGGDHAERIGADPEDAREERARRRGLRVGLKAGGCSGYEYTFNWEQDARDDDKVFDGPNGARLFIDPRSFRLIDGTVLDYDTNLISKGFVFNNPNAKSSCGCGISFSV